MRGNGNKVFDRKIRREGEKMKEIGVAIIGCGAITRVHLDAVVGSKMARLIAVVDSRKERARETAARYSCQWYEDYRTVLADEAVEVIHLCTPHYLHSPMAIEGVRTGKHVLVEKPVAINVGEAEKMIREAKINGRYIGVSFQNRYNPTSLKAKELLESGQLGPVRGIKGLVTWYRGHSYYAQSDWRGEYATEGGGVLINQAIHTLDLMQWFAGDVVSLKGNVSTRLLNDIIEVEDTADATINFQNGARGIFYATNCYTVNSPVEIEIQCTKGSLSLRGEQLILIKDNKQSILVDEDGCNPKYKSYWGKSHGIAIACFYRSVLTNDSGGFISVEEGIKSLQIIEGIYKSSSSGKEIKIKNS